LDAVQTGRSSKQEDIMQALLKYVAPAVAAAAIGGAIVLAPIASAATHVAPAPHTAASPGAPTDTDPLVPYGTEPVSPYRLGYINPNHDEGNTTNGELDVPF
jgi:hypothetical protein